MDLSRNTKQTTSSCSEKTYKDIPNSTPPSLTVGSGTIAKAPLNHNGSEVFLRLWALLLYRDFLPVLEEKDHLVIEDRDPAELPLDVALPSNYINGGDSIRN